MLILRLLLCALLLWGGCAEAFQVQSRACPGGASAPVTWWADVSMDDNASNTTVANAGDGGGWTTPGGLYTYEIHQSGSVEGTGCFFFNRTGGLLVSSQNNVTFEKLEMMFWYKDDNVTSNPVEVLGGIGNSDAGVDTNEILLVHPTNSGEIDIMAKGNTGDYGIKLSTNLNLQANTWTRLRFVVDATISGWSVELYKSTDGINETQVSFGDWSNSTPQIAVFNSPAFIGATLFSGYLFDHLKIRELQ